MKTIPLPIPALSLRPARFVRVLLAIMIFLVVVSVCGQYIKYGLGHQQLKGLVPLFNLNEEGNIPTYFSMLLMIGASLLLALIALLTKRAQQIHVTKWIILCLGFLFMAFDEGFSVHEKLVAPVRLMLGDDQPGIFFFAWVVPAMVILFILALFFLDFLLYIPAATRWRFLIAAAFYLSGAVGMELIEGSYAEKHGIMNFTFSMMATVEESAEITGLILFIRALLKHCTENFSELLLRFET